MKLDSYLILLIKLNSKWINDSKVRPETIKLLEENTGKISSTLVLAVRFWIWWYLKHSQQKKIKWEYIKLKSFSTKNNQQNEKAAYRTGENI